MSRKAKKRQAPDPARWLDDPWADFHRTDPKQLAATSPSPPDRSVTKSPTLWWSEPTTSALFGDTSTEPQSASQRFVFTHHHGRLPSKSAIGVEPNVEAVLLDGQLLDEIRSRHLPVQDFVNKACKAALQRHGLSQVLAELQESLDPPEDGDVERITRLLQQ